MHQFTEMWEPSYEEKLELAESYFLGWDEAEKDYPCDPPMDKSPREAREYVTGYVRKRADIAADKRL